MGGRWEGVKKLLGYHLNRYFICLISVGPPHQDAVACPDQVDVASPPQTKLQSHPRTNYCRILSQGYQICRSPDYQIRWLPDNRICRVPGLPDDPLGPWTADLLIPRADQICRVPEYQICQAPFWRYYSYLLALFSYSDCYSYLYYYGATRLLNL